MMKKIIGFIGILVVAVTMHFNANAVSRYTADTSLDSLIRMNVAHADSENEVKVGCQINIKRGGEWNIRSCSDCAYVSNGIYNMNDKSECVSSD